MRTKQLLATTMVALAVVSCNSYDDAEIKTQLSDHNSRIEAIEKWQTSIDDQLDALQTLVKAIDGRDYITAVTPTTNGYTISFNKASDITITNGINGENGADGSNGEDGEDGANGQNGANGQDGADGADGADGNTPIISVKKNSDGIYYWTVKVGDADANYIFDNEGNKIVAESNITVSADTDGTLYWQINGEWLLDGDGAKIPATGDSFFESVEVSDDGGSVTIKVSGEEPFTLPIGVSSIISFTDDCYLTDGVVTIINRYNDMVVSGSPMEKIEPEINFTINENITDYVAVTATLVSGDAWTKALEREEGPATMARLTEQDGVFTVELYNIDGFRTLKPGNKGIVKITLIKADGSELSQSIIYQVVDGITAYNNDISMTDNCNEISNLINEAMSYSSNTSNSVYPYIYIPEGVELTENIEISAMSLSDYPGLKTVINLGNYAGNITIDNINDALGGSTLEIVAPKATVTLTGARYDNLIMKKGTLIVTDGVIITNPTLPTNNK